MNNVNKAIAIFRSRSYAMLFYDEMRGNGIYCEISPAPPKLATGCGVAVLLDIKDVDSVIRLNEVNKYRITGIYRLYENKDGSYKRIY